jgi:hypothetical protein
LLKTKPSAFASVIRFDANNVVLREIGEKADSFIKKAGELFTVLC